MIEIKLYEKYFPEVEAGRKKATIRRGIKPYTLGAALLVATEDSSKRLKIKITDLHIENLQTLIDMDAFREGYRSVGALRMALKDIYPGLEDYEDLTVIQFDVEPTLQTSDGCDNPGHPGSVGGCDHCFVARRESQNDNKPMRCPTCGTTDPTTPCSQDEGAK